MPQSPIGVLDFACKKFFYPCKCFHRELSSHVESSLSPEIASSLWGEFPKYLFDLPRQKQWNCDCDSVFWDSKLLRCFMTWGMRMPLFPPCTHGHAFYYTTRLDASPNPLCENEQLRPKTVNVCAIISYNRKFLFNSRTYMFAETLYSCISARAMAVASLMRILSAMELVLICWKISSNNSNQA